MKNITMKAMCSLATLGLIAYLAGCSLQQPASAEPLSVQAVTVARKALDADLSIAGVLLPAQTVTIAGKLSGEVTQLQAEVGSVVKNGDTLATLDKKTLEAQLKQARASLDAANAQAAASLSQASALGSAVKSAQGQSSVANINLEAAQKNYSDIKNLFDSGIATKAQMDDAATRLSLAKAQYATASGSALNQTTSSAQAATDSAGAAKANGQLAQANVDLLQIQLDNATIRSPIDGVVVTRTVNRGEVAMAGTPLFTIADTARLQLKGTVPQEAIPLLKVGQVLVVTVDIYPGKAFEGNITVIGPIAVATGGYFPVQIELGNDGTLLAGLSARAALQVKTPAVLSVPDSAIVTGDGKSFVYVIREGLAVRKAIVAGYDNGSETVVLDGLAESEQVAVSNVASLTDKMPVSVNAR
jgi:HlyD family secretion protein